MLDRGRRARSVRALWHADELPRHAILLDDMPHETVYMTNVMNQRGFRAEMSLPAAYDEALRGVRAFSAGQRNR